LLCVETTSSAKAQARTSAENMFKRILPAAMLRFFHAAGNRLRDL
jgi:hypothetical protein